MADRAGLALRLPRASAAALEEGGSVIGLCVGTLSLWMMGFECWSASFQISNRGRGSFSNSAAHCQRLRCRLCLRVINTPAASLAVFILTLGSSAVRVFQLTLLLCSTPTILSTPVLYLLRVGICEEHAYLFLFSDPYFFIVSAPAVSLGCTDKIKL